MAKCWLQIELDDSENTYAPGEIITGTVVVKVLQQCRCKQLTLYWQWRARSPVGSEAGQAEHLLTLNGQEEWLAGQELHYPFRLEAPDSPLTYHGLRLSVDWYLRAEVCVSGWMDTQTGAEVPFFLVPAETRQPAPAATGPESRHGLEVNAPEDSRGNAAIVGACALSLFAWQVLWQFPVLGFLIILLSMGFALAYRRVYRNPVCVLRMGSLWLDSETMAPGGSTGLRIHLQPDQRVREHELSVSLECAEMGSRLYTETVLTRTNRALSAGELLELPSVSFTLPFDAPTSINLTSHSLEWWLQIEVKFEGDKRTFLQRIPIQVQPHRSMTRSTAHQCQARQVTSSPPSEPAPWLQDEPPREEERRGPLPSSEDIRRQLEGGLEVLEAAHAHYTALEEALQAPKWKLHLRPRLETLREASRQEPALVEALERLHHRARSEGWARTEPALVLAHEVEELRARVGALASRQLGPPEDREEPLARRLDRLEQSVIQSLPAPLAPGEKLLCSGGFSPSLSMPGLLLLLGLSFTHCGSTVGIRGPGSGVWWGAWVLLTALCFWRQYRRSGRFWLTESRLIWLPTRGDLLQVPLLEIRPPGGSRSHESVKVELMDGHTLHLAFISRAKRFADALRRQCRLSALREHPRDAAPPEPPASTPG